VWPVQCFVTQLLEVFKTLLVFIKVLVFTIVFVIVFVIESDSGIHMLGKRTVEKETRKAVR